MGLLLLVVLCLVAADVDEQNDRPIIGILTQPTYTLQKYGPNYIAASYVKYLESAGARVVPVHHDAPPAVLREYFDNLNGILFPGGGASLDNTTLYNAGKFFYDLSIEAFDKSGEIFPIVGHCLGFELLTIITSNDFNILGPVDAENITLPLTFTELSSSSRMFGEAPAKIIDILGTEPVTMNNHFYSLFPGTYETNQQLSSFYNVLSTNRDRKGVEFVSSMESVEYPIFAVQWHPEKPQFEWNPNEVINHSPHSIYAMQYMADFTVSQARLSTHRFASAEEEERTVIYNHEPIYTFYDDNDFEQAYFFKDWPL